MIHIQHGDTEAECEDGETVLQCLLRAGVDFPYSCGIGNCLSCISRSESGVVPVESQKGIKDTLRAQGYFLPCICKPTEDIEVAPPDDAALYGRAVVTDIDQLSHGICRVRLAPATDLFYHAGQFVNLRREDGLVRAYSLASVPHLDNFLELHVKRLPRGQMSNWIYDDLRPGDAVDIQGPNGSCFYIGSDQTQPLLLVGNGSGLSPLIGIARDALTAGHSGPIHLYHGTGRRDGLYLDADLRALAEFHGNLTYEPCLSRDPDAEDCRDGRAEDVALADHPDLSGWRVYLCGYPPMVNDARRRAFLAGAGMSDIYADPFELRELREKPRD